jgi:hypothetical protein
MSECRATGVARKLQLTSCAKHNVHAAQFSKEKLVFDFKTGWG